MNPTDHSPHTHLSKHRIEALTDGIFAVAMTLLVIDLHLPEHAQPDSQAALIEAVRALWPNLVAWLISFLVLAMFWIKNHQLYSYVRHVDMRLLWLTIATLAGASLLPFSAALMAQHISTFAQSIYSLNLIALSAASLAGTRYVHAHPALCGAPMSTGVYRAAQMRALALIVVACMATGISLLSPARGNLAFALMVALVPLGRRIEAHYARRAVAVA